MQLAKNRCYKSIVTAIRHQASIDEILRS